MKPCENKIGSAVTGQSEFVMVPRVPTQEMLEAAWADALAEDALGVWRSMIKAWDSPGQDGELASRQR